MDVTLLMLSLLFGSIGFGFFLYGKNAVRMVPLVTGVALMVVPYFFSSWVWLLISCSILTSVPYFLRDQG